MSTTAATSVARGFSLRSAVLGDADAVFRLLGQLDASYLPERATFDATFSAAIDDTADHVLLVAADTRDDVVIGYALTTIARLFSTNGAAAELQELVVDEGSRGRRIGSSLVAAVERECSVRGVRQLAVASRRGADFYEALGYRSTADFLKKLL